jgi:hypothetical protein
MLIGSGLQALATSDKFKPLVLGQIRAAGDMCAASSRRWISETSESRSSASSFVSQAIAAATLMCSN